MQNRLREQLAAHVPVVMMGFLGVVVFVERAASRFAAAGHDDTFITLLAAEMLADGEGLRASDGLPGEIGSSLLHVLCLAALRWLGTSDLFLANKVMGFLCGLTATMLVLFSGARFFPALSRGPARLAALTAFLLAVSLPTGLYWTLGGLETPLVTGLLTWLAYELARGGASRAPHLAVIGCLLVLVRPEGWLYLAPMALMGLAARCGRRWFLIALGVPLVGLLLLIAWRLFAFGVPLPLPALGKLSAGAPLTRVGDGFGYLTAFARASWVGTALLLGFVLSCGLWLHGRRRELLAPLPDELAPRLSVLIVVGAHLITVVLSGGDWMTYYRFVAPALPLLSVGLVQSLTWLARRAAPYLAQLVLLLGGVVSLFMGEGERPGLFPPYITYTSYQHRLGDLFDPDHGATFGERLQLLNGPHRRDHWQLVPFLDGPLKDLLAREGTLTVATYQMGFLPYHIRARGLRGVRFIDTAGITEHELAHAPGVRSPLGLRDGVIPLVFLAPEGETALARIVARRAPDLVYVLETDPHTTTQLSSWGWVLIWAQPRAKVFARRELVQHLLPP